MNILRNVIRPLVAAPFILDAVDALTRPQKHAKKAEKLSPAMRSIGLSVVADHPVLATRVTGALTLGAGLALATGRMPRTAAAVLAAVSLPTALAKTLSEETASEKFSTAVSRGALIGAALLASLDREGNPSLVWRASDAMSRAKNAAEAKANYLYESASQQVRDTASKLTPDFS